MKKSDPRLSIKDIAEHGLDRATIRSINDYARQYLSSAAALDRLAQPYIDAHMASLKSSESFFDSALKAFKQQQGVAMLAAQGISLAQVALKAQRAIDQSGIELARRVIEQDRSYMLSAIGDLSAVNAAQAQLAA